MDIWPRLTRETPELARGPLFWNFRGNSFALREGGWKLITGAELDASASELYQVGSDPYETRDLAAAETERVHRMLELIAEERKLDDSSKRDDVE